MPIHALTGLRFVAALMVFLFHASPPRFSEGFAGVAFFYVLSGFILTHHYRQTLRNLRWQEVRNFYACRLARIYPVHVLTFIAIIPLMWPHLRANLVTHLWRAIPNLTLTQSICSPCYTFNAVSWSLSDECFFCALFPAIIWITWRLRLDRVRRAGPAMAIIWSAAFAYAYANRNALDLHWRCYVNPLVRLSDFSIGVLLGITFAQVPRCHRTTGIVASVIYTASEVLSAGLLVLAWKLSSQVPLALRFACYYTTVIAAAVLVFACERGLLSRIIGSPPGRLLGEISFAFYMLHQLTTGYLLKYKDLCLLGSLTTRQMETVTFVVVLALSYPCYRWYEMPLRRLVRNRFCETNESTAQHSPPVGPAASRVAA